MSRKVDVVILHQSIVVRSGLLARSKEEPVGDKNAVNFRFGS